MCPKLDLFDVIEGFNFKELLIFEKPHFLQLIKELDLPDVSEIVR